MNTLVTDLRLAFRALRIRPLFAGVAVGSLALGVAAVTTIFAVVNKVVLSPVPGVGEAERIVEVGTTSFGRGFGSSAWPDYEDLRDGTTSLEAVAAFSYAVVNVSRGGEGRRANGILVTPEYFPVLGVEARIGRTFVPEEGRDLGAHPVVVVSHDYWTGALGSDPEVVGSELVVNRMPHTVIGVTPDGFRGHTLGYAPAVYLPMTQYGVLTGDGTERFSRRGGVWHQMLGRIAPGSGIEAVRQELDALAASLSEAYPETNENRGFAAQVLKPVPAAVRAPVRLFLLALLGMGTMILLVTCANVAGMFLARAGARVREVAVRLAMGAPRSALIRQLLVEALMVFLLGGAAGLLLAAWVTGLIRPELLPIPLDVSFALEADLTVTLFALGATLATGLVFGLLPAIHATRINLLASLKAEGGGAGRRSGGWMRKGFVGGQVALSLVLLMTSALFLRTMQEASRVETGFDPAGAYVTGVDLDLEGVEAGPDGWARQRSLLERLRTTPGVAAAALALDLPLDLGSHGNPVAPVGWEDPSNDDGWMGTGLNRVSPGYFSALRIPVLEGRVILPDDRDGSEPVVVVSETLARRAWPSGSALGRQLRAYGDDRTWTVVGVVADVKNQYLTEDPEPFVYYPLAQSYAAGTNVVVRTEDGGDRAASVLRNAILAEDPGMSMSEIVSLERYTSLGLLPQKVAAGVATLLGALALLLAGLGIYGVVAHEVQQRRREIGVRVALGAGVRRVVRMVVRQGLVLALPGALAGAVLALLVGRVIQGFLLGVSPADPVAILTVPVILVLVVVAAALAPARRAASVDPAVSLRAE